MAKVSRKTPISFLLAPIKKFVRSAPLYDHYSPPSFKNLLWQRSALLLYSTKREILFGTKIRKRVEELRLMKGAFAGTPALVIANGPSAKGISQESVQNLRRNKCKFYVMNEFYRNEQLTSIIEPDFYFMTDPVWENEDRYRTSPLHEYFNIHTDCREVRPASTELSKLFTKKPLYVNWIPGAGLVKAFNPIGWRCYPDGVLFSVLAFAKYVGHYPVYVIGADTSMYMNHYVTREGIIRVSKASLHSYPEEGVDNEIDPQLTRHMSDVLFSAARFLDDLRRYCADFAVNVGVDDTTNDALPRGCLLSKPHGHL